ncbi:type VI secretion protein VasK [Erwinia billingiae]|uniref:ImcF-related family protein n=1 Tax=Erwinia billingiae TaxID=182337 RepID=UPI0012464F6C|nr:ImcF-related family protein [Erwinia billingiae]QEW33880.1 type VI secretion protein VasK [Erwinia billingiae]
MQTTGNLPGRLGRVGLLIAGIAAIWWLIVRFGGRIGIDTTGERSLALVALCMALAFLRYAPAIARYVKELYHRRQQRKGGALPSGESRTEQTPPRHLTVTELKRALRARYGRWWWRKVKVLMMTGKAGDVEKIAPGLSSQYWLEDCGTVLLWGGNADSAPESQWLTALHKLRRRPVDALVWVTYAFDRFDRLDGKATENPISPDGMDAIAHRLSARYEALGWQLPLYVWSLHPGQQEGRIVQSVGCLLPVGATPAELDEQLALLAAKLTAPGTRQVCGNPDYRFLLELKNLLTSQHASPAHTLSTLLNPYRPLPLAGVMFSPQAADAARTVKHHWGKDRRWDGLLDSLASLPSGLRAQRLGFSWQRTATTLLSAMMMLCAVGMVASFIANRAQIREGDTLVRQAEDTRQAEQSRLQALLELQQLMQKLQHRQLEGAPWYSRFGLSQNDDLLAQLWSQYRERAVPLLRDAAAAQLGQQLNALLTLSPDSPKRNVMIKPAYDQLKLYLMLTRPEKMDAGWFTPALLRAWPSRAGVKDGYWQGSGVLLLRFYAANLPQHAGWKLPVDDSLVENVRAILVQQMGMRNGESSLYQKMLSQVAHQYADLRLNDMVAETDAERLFTSNEVVPGMFTRQAWEGAVKSAIEKVANERREEMDWVLSNSKVAVTADMTPEALQERLTARYFADFSASWLSFLNSLHWNNAVTLSDAVDQLTLMADVRQSPLVALMNTLSVQGRTGQTGDKLSDSLVKSAQNLFNRSNQPAIDQSKGVHGPLDSAFGPVLALIDGTAGGQGNASLSLQTFLTRVTQVRLKLQQIINAPDPQAMTRTLAQTVFQGKAIDLTETRDYGSLVAASLGQEWSGFGNTLFVRPMEQAWQQVLTPAAESLNAQWKAAIVGDWKAAFGGRYPLKASSSEISLPLLGQYLNADSGRIARFLQTRLNGVLHKEGSHWVADSINAQGLIFNPAFIRAVDTLSHISDVVFTAGPAGMSFELRPGTAEGVMQTNLTIDNQKLVYVNQLPVWKRFTWPADTEAPGAALSWVSTQAGTRLLADIPGSWGWIRLLDTAQISLYPGLNSSWQVSWKAPDGRKLNYMLRTEAGEGPMALLKLRNFVLPDAIFLTTDGTPSQADTDIQ